MDNIKTNIVEITKGNTGTGLLIENDGYISLSDNNKELFEALKADGNYNNLDLPYPFVVNAIFQKYGIENQNGRIYPEKVLKREVEKYQKKIKERSSYGECYLPDTLVLTVLGWKPLSDVSIGEEVITLNTSTNKIEIQKVTNIISYEYNGDLIRLENSKINDLVTPNHGFPIYNNDNSFVNFFTANDILNNNIPDSSFIPMIDQDLNDIKDLEGSANILDKIKISDNQIRCSKEHYNGKVMCIEIPNHVWYCKCNDKAHWTKNCNHPSDSTIDLGRIAINIIELHWEGNTLVGKIEIPISQGFRKLGIISCLADMVAHWILSGLKIGISSRGLGSVEKQYDKLIVGDDFELICWDVVSEPSTPGAWIAIDSNDLTQYIDRTDNKSSNNFSNKLSKFDDWLNV